MVLKLYHIHKGELFIFEDEPGVVYQLVSHGDMVAIVKPILKREGSMWTEAKGVTTPKDVSLPVKQVALITS